MPKDSRDLRTRRAPWATLVLLAGCVVAHVGFEIYARGAYAAAGAKLTEAQSYWLEHPYLEPGSLLEAELGTARVALERSRFVSARNRQGAPPIPAGVKRRQQESLASLLDETLRLRGSFPAQRWGLRATERDPPTFLSHAFLHANSVHLFASLFFLLVLGFFLEAAWGIAIFAPVAVAGTAAAGASFAFANPQFASPLCGMSGTIAALLGAYAVRFRGDAKGGPYVGIVGAAAVYLLLPVWLGVEWSIVRELGEPSHPFGTPGVSYWAFGGGMLFGVVAGGMLELLGVEEGLAASSDESDLARVANPLLDRALQARGDGRAAEAFALLSDLLRAQPDAHDAAFALWDVASDLGRAPDAAPELVRAIRHEVKVGDTDSAVGHWLELSELGFEGYAEPALLLRMAMLLREAGKPEAALQALRVALERGGSGDDATVASRVARAARDLDPRVAEDAAWRALRSLDLSLEERQRLEVLLGEVIEPISSDLAGAPVRSDPPPDRDEAAASPAGEGGPFARPAAIDLDIEARRLEAVEAVPVEVEEEGLLIEVGASKKRVRFDRIAAIAVAAIGGLSAKPVIVVDLVLNWMSTTDEPLRVIRLRGDRFDPRRLAPGCPSPVEALRRFLSRLVSASGASPLPDERSAVGQPFASFEDLASYHRDVLMVDVAAVDAYGWTDR